jgi:glyoxylate reductase
VRLGVDSETSAVPRKSLLDGVQAADVLVSMLTESVDRELLEAGSRLLGVANYAVGYNNVDLVSATELGMPVTNTPGVLTDTTADLAWALLMAVARNIVPADRYMRSGRFRLWGPNLFLGADVSRGGSGERKVLGIVGFGRVGQAVARRAQGFDMRVLAHDPVLKDLIAKTGGVEYAELDDLLAQSDFVTLHTLLDESTRHLIDARSFEKMKPTAYLINTSRGPVVDEKALVEALGRKRIAGAALDVFENEPEMTPGLAELDNVVVVPHIASASRDTRDQMATKCAENAVALLRREKAPNCVNPEVYDTDAYRRRLRQQ